MRVVHGAILAAALGVPGVVLAQQNPGTPATSASSAVAKNGELAEGEVRRVDRQANKVTIRHGEIKSLEMPPMTMVYQVKDKALFERLKPGDKIRFAAEKQGGSYVLTRVEPAS